MPDKKIGINTPLALTPKGLVCVIGFYAFTGGEAVFTVRSLVADKRITACARLNACTVVYKNGKITEVRLIGDEGSSSLNAEPRDCGTVTDWLAEHDLFLDENASAART